MRKIKTALVRGDVMEGVVEILPEIQVEAFFPDGPELVSAHQSVP